MVFLLVPSNVVNISQSTNDGLITAAVSGGNLIIRANVSGTTYTMWPQHWVPTVHLPLAMLPQWAQHSVSQAMSQAAICQHWLACFFHW
jgi:hypothetical protein